MDLKIPCTILELFKTYISSGCFKKQITHSLANFHWKLPLQTLMAPTPVATWPQLQAFMAVVVECIATLLRVGNLTKEAPLERRLRIDEFHSLLGGRMGSQDESDTWLITLVNKCPKWGFVFTSKRPKWLTKMGGLLTY